MTTTTTETPIATGEITNTCTCTVYDEVTGEHTEELATNCYGDCWEDSVYFFGLVTEELRDSNNTDWWQVTNLRLWNGDFGGLFHAKTVTELISGMTVRSEWTMRYEVFSDRIDYSLSHHDAPMGSKTTLLPVSEDSRMDWGL
jgi:hypothetical protein